MPLAYLKTASNWVLKFSGSQRVVPLNSPLSPQITQLIKENASDDAFLKLIDVTHAIKTHPSGLFGVEDGVVYVAGEALPVSLSLRVLDFADNGLPFQPLLKFWDRCKANPDARARSDLYAFLEHNGHPITADGCFIAYRYVRDMGNGKFMDNHTGTMDNSVGMEVKMRREDCDSNPAQTCSRGLHCAAFEYARSGAGNDNPVVEVKVDPADVVAIPLDYNGQKMRTCRFQVMCVNTDKLTSHLYDPQNVQEDEDDSEDEEYDDETGAESTPVAGVDFTSAQERIDLPPVATAAFSDEEDEVAAIVSTITRDKLVKHANSMKRDAKGHFLPNPNKIPRKRDRSRKKK